MSIVRSAWDVACEIVLIPFLLVAGIVGWVVSYF
jgi:hypothetical protein